MRTIALLFFSNVFMTFAVWASQVRPYVAVVESHFGVLVDRPGGVLPAVPANRLGFGAFTGFQLKISRKQSP